MNKNNQVTLLDHSLNKIGDDRLESLSTTLMIENNKVTSLNLSDGNIRDEGTRQVYCQHS